MEYIANKLRYEDMIYNRCGSSGLLLPAFSLGLWHNFGSMTSYDKSREMLVGAFDLGITHFDLANNYGPKPGSAEETFGKVISEELKSYRDEIVVSTKAGYDMWPGPYGEWGSKKNLVASVDQSLRRMKLDYVDIFYHHRPDPNTPLEETMDALSGIIKSGKALYVGISNYNAKQTIKAAELLNNMGVHCLIHQMKLSLLERQNEEVAEVVYEKGIGGIAFSPLAQGILTGKYQHGIPAGSRAYGDSVFLSESNITNQVQEMTRRLTEIAGKRGQSLAQMALAWVQNHQGITSVIIGASRMEQVRENLESLKNTSFSQEELDEIKALTCVGENKHNCNC